MSARSWRFWTSPFLRRFSAIELLVALAVLFVSMPFVEALPSGPLIESILFTIVLVSGVPAIEGNPRTMISAAFLALITLVARWLHFFRPNAVPPEVFLVLGSIFILFVIFNLLRFVLRAPTVDTEVLCASVSAYLLLGLLWTFGYWLVAEIVPGAFSFNTAATADTSMKGFNALYFSLITLCTVGYGDITPIAKVARMLAATEAMTGLLYVAVLIARLVSIQTTTKPYDS